MSVISVLLTGRRWRSHVSVGLRSWLGIGLYAFVAMTSSLSAQDRWATITVDTGDFTPGRKEFSRYTTPVQCLAAARNVNFALRRGAKDQEQAVVSMWMTPGANRVDSAAAAATMLVAQQCGARFTLANTPAVELPYLFALALLGGNDSLAAAVVTQRLANTKATATYDSLVTEIADTYLSVTPMRMAAVEALATRVGPGTPSQRRVRTIAVLTRILQRAVRTFDRPRMRAYVEQVLALGRDLTGEDFDIWVGGVVAADMLRYSYQQLAAIAFVDHPDSLPAIAHRAQADLGRIPVPPPSPFLLKPFDIKKASLDAVLGFISPVGSAQAQVTSGIAVPPLEVPYWFPARPTEGQVTLILSLTGWEWDGTLSWHEGCVRDVPFMLNIWNTPSNCMGPIAWIREWMRRYGTLPNGTPRLAITLVQRTEGYALNSLALTPREEAERFNWYFREHLKLPVTVAVLESPVRVLPAPDHRRFVCDYASNLPTDSLCTKWRQSRAVAQYLRTPVTLLGTRGELLYAGPGSVVFDLVLAKAMIASTSRAANTSNAASYSTTDSTPLSSSQTPHLMSQGTP